MELRYRLAVVTEAGDGLGREIAVALSRVGAAVLSVDRDLSAAEGTAALVGRARVAAWALQVDPSIQDDLVMLADRARDLGGMDLLVVVGTTPSATSDHERRAPKRLTELFVEGLTERRGRSDGSPAVVHVCGRRDTAHRLAGSAPEARVMAVVGSAVAASEVARAVVDLLARGVAGEVVELTGDCSATRPARRRTT